MKLKALAAAAAVLVLAGCGWHGTGTVTGRADYPAYYQTSMICGAYGTNGVCSVWVPIGYTVPESWRLKLHADDGDHWIDVTQDHYNTAKLGDQVTVKDGNK